MHWGMFWALWSALFVFLIPIIITDIRTQTLSNKTMVFGAAAGLTLRTAFSGAHGLLFGLGGLAAGLILGIAGERMSLLRINMWAMGDVKLMAMIGVFLGASGMGLVVGLGCVVYVFYRFLRLLRKWDPRTPYAFAPWLGIGSVLLLAGQLVLILNMGAA